MAAGQLHNVGNFSGPFPGSLEPFANYGPNDAYNRAFPPPHAIARGSRRPTHSFG